MAGSQVNDHAFLENYAEWIYFIVLEVCADEVLLLVSRLLVNLEVFLTIG
jgi:hypothetical protein